ncbi:hypothetical protein TWF696_003236 [Orbilia brochopaga]|uniref:Thioredoxin domain-containing protein n=1 Tax=Orbilia brochopaga TaxID=3140254 RepID=A0AAV9TY80_9PEZI
MIRDATPLFRDPEVNLAAPSQMLAVLQTTMQPLYVFFTASKDSSTGEFWDTKTQDAMYAIYDVFRKHNKRHHFATIPVGSKEDWQNSDHPIRKRWKITQIPTIVKYELLKISGEVFYHSRRLIGSECIDRHKLALLRDGPMAGIPSDWDRWRAKFYQSDTNPEADGWEYEFVGIQAANPKPGPSRETVLQDYAGPSREMVLRDHPGPSRAMAPRNYPGPSRKMGLQGQPGPPHKIVVGDDPAPKTTNNPPKTTKTTMFPPNNGEVNQEILAAVRALVGPGKPARPSNESKTTSSSDDSIFHVIYDVVPRRRSP